MAQATSNDDKKTQEKKEKPFLESEIIDFVKNSVVWEVHAGGVSYINPWTSFHFTRGKDTDHITIQESSLQCINEFLKYSKNDGKKISLFYTWAHESKDGCPKELTCKIIDRSTFVKNLHFVSPASDIDPNHRKIITHKPMTFVKAYKKIATLKEIKKQSIKVYNAIIKKDAQFLNELKERFKIELSVQEISQWSC